MTTEYVFDPPDYAPSGKPMQIGWNKIEHVMEYFADYIVEQVEAFQPGDEVAIRFVRTEQYGKPVIKIQVLWTGNGHR